MYVPSAFKVHPALALAFAGARGFGLVIACDGGRPVAAQVPFLLIEADGKSPRAVFHVARGNPLAALAEKCAPWLIAVQGADAYVSADWYASREQVPTWLYETVQLGGPVHVMPAEHARAHLDALTARFEQPLAPKPPWSSAKLTPERLAMLTSMIVVIEMQVETIEASFKLNQHKNDADNIAVAAALAGQGDPGAKAIAARMVALRPHLLYEGHGQVARTDAAHVEGT
jgi:transcriptional regulator